MLTAYERTNGPAYYVVGIRYDGERAVLAETSDDREAKRLCKAFADQLEDYHTATVEAVATGQCVFHSPLFRRPL